MAYPALYSYQKVTETVKAPNMAGKVATQKCDVSKESDVEAIVNSLDEWGGLDSRRELERNLLWKLDKRMSILILIYILNYVRIICLT